MKRSKEVALVLIASASLVACGPDTQETKREVYASRDKCVADWGAEDRCEQLQGGGGYWGPHYFYYGGGAYYFPRGSDKAVPAGADVKFAGLRQGARSLHSTGTVNSSRITRGGFGRSSSFHGGGS